jgi:hypothetical protein
MTDDGHIVIDDGHIVTDDGIYTIYIKSMICTILQ